MHCIHVISSWMSDIFATIKTKAQQKDETEPFSKMVWTWTLNMWQILYKELENGRRKKVEKSIYYYGPLCEVAGFSIDSRIMHDGFKPFQTLEMGNFEPIFFFLLCLSFFSFNKRRTIFYVPCFMCTYARMMVIVHIFTHNADYASFNQRLDAVTKYKKK